MPPENKIPKNTVRKYYSILLAIIIAINIALFFGFSLQSHWLIKEQIIEEARAFFVEITITRQWIANHQGVYVKLKPGVEPNTHLEKIPGLKTLIHDETGQPYILKNPAIVTKEISELANNNRLFSFHITSLNPINPDNSPDDFEREALQGFADGKFSELSRFEKSGSSTFLRYMAPLITEANCLQCHGFQGYKPGDIRGGISVTVPADKVQTLLRQNIIYMILATLGIIALIFTVTRLISQRFILELTAAQEQLFTHAATDFLTGLLNRREGLRRFREELSLSKRKNMPLSMIVVDIDRFKSINDTKGHLVGDRVLEYLAPVMQKELREYDIICRYGGEEFLFVLPDTPLKQAEEIAERLRGRVEQTSVPLKDGEIKVTISLGVAQFSPSETIDILITRADQALYRAKEQGRNRVAVAA